MPQIGPPRRIAGISRELQTYSHVQRGTRHACSRGNTPGLACILSPRVFTCNGGVLGLAACRPHGAARHALHHVQGAQLVGRAAAHVSGAGRLLRPHAAQGLVACGSGAVLVAGQAGQTAQMRFFVRVRQRHPPSHLTALGRPGLVECPPRVTPIDIPQGLVTKRSRAGTCAVACTRAWGSHLRIQRLSGRSWCLRMCSRSQVRPPCWPRAAAARPCPAASAAPPWSAACCTTTSQVQLLPYSGAKQSRIQLGRPAAQQPSFTEPSGQARIIRRVVAAARTGAPATQQRGPSEAGIRTGHSGRLIPWDPPLTRRFLYSARTSPAVAFW